MALDKAEVKKKIDETKQKAKKAKIEADMAKKLKINPNPTYIDLDNLPYTGNPESDSKMELDELQEAFRRRIKDESHRFALATDSEHWSCLCFQTREQADAFWQALDMSEYGGKYIDGEVLAKKLGIELPSADVPYHISKADKTWSQFVEDE